MILKAIKNDVNKDDLRLKNYNSLLWYSIERIHKEFTFEQKIINVQKRLRTMDYVKCWLVHLYDK